MHNRPVYWLGTDEAGYGARIGPLTISLTCWEMPSLPDGPWDLSHQTGRDRADSFQWVNHPLRDPVDMSPPLLVADSKKLYKSGKGLLSLQRVVTSWLLACRQVDQPPRCFPSLWTATTGEPQEIAGRNSYWQPLRDRVTEEELDQVPPDQQANLDAKAWRETSALPVGMTTRVIGESAFNTGLLSYGNKATLLSLQTLSLVRDWLSRLSDASVVIVDLDRHGGRKRYLPMLLSVLGADWMDVVSETSTESLYAWKRESGTIWFRFSVDGERRYPVALASIFSKLMRERSMQCVNAFWAKQQPGIKATAGYPVDAERFRKSTSEIRQRLGIGDDGFWRNA